MKVTSFHFMPYRDLPDDAERRYRSMWVDAPFPELADVLFHDPRGPAAQAALALPSDDEERATAMAALVWAAGATGKFVWPIPDKGLRRRLHRVTAPALIA